MVVIGGIYGLVGGAAVVPVLALLSSVAIGCGAAHMLLAVLGWRAMRLHSLLLLSVVRPACLTACSCPCLCAVRLAPADTRSVPWCVGGPG